MKIIGHRGFKAEYPENTLASFRHAFACGINAVELDVHLTLDRQVVVTHDFTLSHRLFTHRSGKRFAVEPLISELPFTDLRFYDCGNHQNHKTGFPRNQVVGEQVPLLAEVLALKNQYPDLAIEWNVEIKYADILGLHPREVVVEKVLAAIEEYGELDKTTIFSFDVEVLRRVKKLMPRQRINFLYEAKSLLVPLEQWLDVDIRIPDWRHCRQIVDELGAEVFSPYYRFIELFPGWKRYFPVGKRDCELYVWTVNSPRSWRRLLGQVDAIITDEPTKLREWLKHS